MQITMQIKQIMQMKRRLTGLTTGANFVTRERLRWLIAVWMGLLVAMPSGYAEEDPAVVISERVNTLLDEFVAQREQLEGNKSALFELVDRVASPLFDFNYITKLVLAKNWKKATAEQRLDFATEFKRLLINTYATALFRYTDQSMTFGETTYKEKQGVRFATVNTEVLAQSGGQPITVVYSMLNPGDGWKIYNLTVADLNLAINYRNVIQSIVQKEGLEGAIEVMKTKNDKNEG